MVLGLRRHGGVVVSGANRTRKGHGRGHWWAQRLTALALIPLLVWFVAALVALTGAGHGALVGWLGTPAAATATVALLVVMFHHTQLGLQVVLEDYVADGPVRRISILLTRTAALALAGISVLAVLSIALGGF